MRLILLDNGLGDELGHHAHMARNLVADARALGCRVDLHATTQMTAATQADLGARPTFSEPFYGPIGDDPFRAFLRGRRYLEEFCNSGQGVSRGDLVFVPTASVIELFTLLHWRRSRDYGLKFAFLFHNLDHPKLDDPLDAYLWTAAAAEVERVGSDRLWLGATNAALCDEVSRRTGRGLRLNGAITWYEEMAQARPVDGPVRVGFLGGLRRSKGAHKIPALTTAMRRRRPDWRIVVQCGADEQLAPSLAPFAFDPGVEIVRERLDDAALCALLRSLDVLICPYDRAVYRRCSSGLMNLAAGWGVPCVAPSGTTLSDQLETPARPLGRVYDGDDDEAIVGAVDALVARREANASDAPAAALRWRAVASGAILLRELLSWAGAEAAGAPR